MLSHQRKGFGGNKCCALSLRLLNFSVQDGMKQKRICNLSQNGLKVIWIANVPINF